MVPTPLRTQALLIALLLFSGCLGTIEDLPESELSEQEIRKRCGDGRCHVSESCSSCPADCGACVAPPACGDGTCGGGETCSSCAADCGACPATCGDGACNGSETCTTCSADCGACPATCGDGACNGSETCSSCAADCGACPATCGDGACNGSETCSSCAADCGACSAPSVGPQASITCPAGAVNISPGQEINTVVNGHPTGTVFCVLAGTYYPATPINLKARQQLIGQYGAVIDGRNVRMTYDIGSTSIIRSWNCGSVDCSGGVVRNLVLRNLAQYTCVGIYGPTSNDWTIDHNEIHGCLNGIIVGNNRTTRVTNNYVHHNVGDSAAADPALRGGGYGSYLPTDILWEDNVFAYNGQNQKICGSTNVTFRNNHLHHNLVDGIWYDGDNTGILIEGNLIEDHGREGIFLEISAGAVVRNNIVRRSGNSGIFVSTSRDNDIYNNTLEDNSRAIQYFLNCAAVGYPYPGSIGFDLRNNNAHDNIIKVGSNSGALATDLTYLGSCTSTEIAPYVNGSKNNLFQHSRYYTPTTSGSWWLWSTSTQTWSQWQALGQDTTSTLELSSSYTGSGGPSTGPDLSPPTVSISNPPESSVVSSTITVVANASDNIGVIGVQFKIDGVNVGSELLSSPFNLVWNTTGWINGNHALQAVARDAAGNVTTSAANTVTVSN